ncbi:MAG TPA: endonuclease/exonuclease/phosphatase family protein [Thermoanaerobaculia bacterium]|nr:endonuclease/exonuclease/phosphatase family protein [Thermoanaerobaculia bacterium]
MRLLFVIASLLGALTAAGQEVVRIGAWNIEWLGAAHKRGAGNAGIPQNASDLATYIIASRVDVLGLEEITRNGPDDTNRTMTAALKLVRQKTGNTWEHVLFDKPNGDRDQRIGVAWNTARARLVGDPVKIDVPNDTQGVSELWERHPHAVKFSFGEGKTDVVLVVLHMKSNRSSVPPPVRRRELEAGTLVAALPQVRSAMDDEDVVLIGDANVLSADEIAARIFTDADFIDLNADDEGTHVSTDTPPFDRIFVPQDDEFEDSIQRVFDSAFRQPRQMSLKQFRRRFSDHFMIMTKVKVLEDDD